MGRRLTGPPGSSDHLEVIAILRDARMRRVLSILRDRSDPLGIQELATRLASRGTGMAPSEVSAEEYTSIRIDLRHRCLPKLESVGWIERHPEGVSVDESFPFRNGESALPDLEATDDSFWETICVLLADPLRQELLQIVANRHDPLTLEELAAELAGSSGPGEPLESPDAESRLLGRLHHADLPKLTSVGLIEYDPDEKTVTRTRSLMTLVDRIDLGTRLTRAMSND